MKYRLKDKSLQEKLDALTDNKFSKSFEKSSEHIDVCKDYCEDFVVCGVGVIRVRLYENSFEKVPEYDPHRWNEWPDVTPPEGVSMRAEVLSKEGKAFFKGAAFFRDGDWNVAGRWIDSDRRVRFRPWDDTTAPTKSTLNKKILQEIIKALESHPEAYDLGYLIDDVTEAANELPDEEDKE